MIPIMLQSLFIFVAGSALFQLKALLDYIKPSLAIFKPRRLLNFYVVRASSELEK